MEYERTDQQFNIQKITLEGADPETAPGRRPGRREKGSDGNAGPDPLRGGRGSGTGADE